MRRLLLAVVLLLVAVAAVAPAAAQEGPQVLVEGLLNPRNMAFDADGNLYIAEAGIAGPQMTVDDTPYGATGRISVLAPDGTLSVAVQGLISYREGNPLGANAIQVTDESLWVLLGETSDFSIPFTHALVELDKTTGRVKNFIDLLTLELTDDPDGNVNEQSNPTDFAVAPDGTILIANAGCNCLMAWTAEAGLSVAAAWPFDGDNPVPTTVEVGPDGDIYVGFLTGFPFPQGGSRVERWRGGELVQTYPGLTAVTGLLVTADGTIYAAEFGVFNQGWGPGRVVRVTENGPEPVLENLTNPYGLAQAPDGTIVISTGAIGAGAGQIVVLPGM